MGVPGSTSVGCEGSPAAAGPAGSAPDLDRSRSSGAAKRRRSGADLTLLRCGRCAASCPAGRAARSGVAPPRKWTSSLPAQVKLPAAAYGPATAQARRSGRRPPRLSEAAHMRNGQHAGDGDRAIEILEQAIERSSMKQARSPDAGPARSGRSRCLLPGFPLASAQPCLRLRKISPSINFRCGTWGSA